MYSKEQNKPLVFKHHTQDIEKLVEQRVFSYALKIHSDTNH